MNINWIYTFRVLLGISLAAIALPYVLVFVEQASGALLGQQDWVAQGNEFGPWRGSWEGFTIFFPSLVLAPIAVIVSIIVALMQARWRPIPGGLGLFGLHVATILLQLQTLGWLIE
jgi:hypothetical protein